MSQKTVSANFQVSIETSGVESLEQCIRDFNEMVEEWRKSVLVRTATASTNDQRKYDDYYETVDEETNGKK